MSLKRAKNANAIFKDAVFGFTREHEKKERIMVPAMIKYLVLNYYLLDESFASDDGARIKLSEDKSVALLIPYNIPKTMPYIMDRGLVRGIFHIGDSMNDISECKWTLQFKEQPINVQIGLIQDPYIDIISFGMEPQIMHHGMKQPFAFSIVKGTQWDVTRDALPWSNVHDAEYMVQMCLDIKRKELLFYTNGILVIKLKKSYSFMESWDLKKCRLGVQLNDKTNYVKLVEFSTKH